MRIDHPAFAHGIERAHGQGVASTPSMLASAVVIAPG
jgi:hypothetical protein